MYDPYQNWVILRGQQVVRASNTRVHDVSFLDIEGKDGVNPDLLKQANETLHQLIDVQEFDTASEIIDWLASLREITPEHPILERMDAVLEEDGDEMATQQDEERPTDPRRKFTEEQVREIRKLKGKATAAAVGERYNVTGSTIYSIWSGKTYSEV